MGDASPEVFCMGVKEGNLGTHMTDMSRLGALSMKRMHILHVTDQTALGLKKSVTKTASGHNLE